MPQLQKPVAQQYPPNFHNQPGATNRLAPSAGGYNMAKKETGKMPYQVPGNLYTGNPNPQPMGNIPNQVPNNAPNGSNINSNPNAAPQNNIVQNQIPRATNSKGEEKPPVKQGKKK